MLALDQIKKDTKNNPNEPVLKFYEQHEVDLTKKYGSGAMRDHWPLFQSVNSGLYKAKNKALPPIPTDINSIELLDEHRLTLADNKPFLLSQVSNSNHTFLLFGSETQWRALAASKMWNCDSTFKTSL